jgi:hypothetical protein
MIKNKEKIRKYAQTFFRMLSKSLFFVALLNTINTFSNAASFEDTQLVKGTENLVNAVISWMTGIAITICIGYFIYYVYCLKTNDEGERRRNMQNIKTTLIALILITCGVSLINVILSFYK